MLCRRNTIYVPLMSIFVYMTTTVAVAPSSCEAILCPYVVFLVEAE